MEIIPILLKEMDEEAQTTRKMLGRIPNDKFDWAPHVKSMDIRRLANHIAELPAWITMVLNTEELDFAANPYEPTFAETSAGVLQIFEKSLAEGRAELEKANNDELAKTWILRNGDMILDQRDKAGVIRIAYSQTVHHRAQLGVYLRLLNVPIPASYGPSADEH